MTSNIRPTPFSDLRDVLREHFKPEFISRLPERLASTRNIELELTDAARELIGNLGYDPVYGARPRNVSSRNSSSTTSRSPYSIAGCTTASRSVSTPIGVS